MTSYTSISYKISNLTKNTLLKNSSWGIISQIMQTVFLSLFFVILARKFSTTIFAKYIIANAIYQLVSAFSTMGLSQWFIREYLETKNKPELIGKFLKMQVYFGLAFYVLNVIFAFVLYDEYFTRILIILMGCNVMFDNVINAVKCLNIANFEQKKTFIILSLEAFLKFLAACFLFIFPFSMVTLLVILIGLRFVTLNLFLNLGSSNSISLRDVFKFKVSYNDVRSSVFLNWAFIIIGGVSIINWRISNIIISKTLTAFDVANYEISFKIFSIAQILPVVVSTSVFPMLVKYFRDGVGDTFLSFYKKVHSYYTLFGIFSYTFIFSFAQLLIPQVFGIKYITNPEYTKQMFLTILVFPTVLLQANILIAMKLEKLDMLLNIIALVINVAMCSIGIFYFKSLAVVNYSIFISFLSFHIFQDLILVKKNVISFKSAAVFYIFNVVFIYAYMLLSNVFNPYLLFSVVWTVFFALIFLRNKIKPFRQKTKA